MIPFNDSSLNMEPVLVKQDLSNVKEELAISAVEMKFCHNLFTSILKEEKSFQLTKYDNILNALEALQADNEQLKNELLSLSIQFEGYAECDDMQCENFYSTNHLAYKEKVEKHFSQYRTLKKKLLTRINASNVSNE